MDANVFWRTGHDQYYPKMIPTNKRQEECQNGKNNRFVLHEHTAKSVHLDLRLERDGVLKCWTLPRGMPKVSKEKCIAIESKDQQTSILYFSGIIPQKQSGTGELKIEDCGTYETLFQSDLKIEFILSGKINTGRYILVRFQKAGSKTWLLMKAD